MTNKDLSNKPHVLAPECWWYEEPRGLRLVVEFREGERLLETRQYQIPWGQVRKALDKKLSNG